MSLISHLYRGELAEWCVDRFTGSKEVAGRISAETRNRDAVRPPVGVEKRHWSHVNRAFSIRMAALVQAAPPYAALLGLVSTGLVSRDWAHYQAARYPTHAELSPTERRRALDLRPTTHGWTDVNRGSAFVPAPYYHEGYQAEPVLADLFDRMRAYFAAHAPLGQLGSERGLARLCSLLAAFKYAYRNDSLDEPAFRLFRNGVPTVEQLHSAAVDDATTDELVALARRLDESGALAELRRLAGDPPPGQPLGYAGPTFFHHWTDNDLVITGPAGGTLIDVHTAIATNKTAQSRLWVWKLLTSAWLDTADSYQVHSVGLYFARQGALITWPVDELADILLEGGDRDAARDEFRALAEQLRIQERPIRATAPLKPGRHTIAVTAVITNDRGRVLVARRRDTGLWKVPGGVLGLDEPIPTGLRRLVEEETGVVVEPERLTGVYQDVGLGMVALVFRAHIADGEPASTEDSSEVGWWPADRVDTELGQVIAVNVRDALAGQAAVRLHNGDRLLSN
ncbi:NUDIX hydrolase [Micromonospora wenchangensis]|uniref:NUDIX hydrolase n=1 Tax=Micromonospora wenchangensis TaxID=1185415 RepID=UPI003D746EDC